MVSRNVPRKILFASSTAGVGEAVVGAAVVGAGVVTEISIQNSLIKKNVFLHLEILISLILSFPFLTS